MREQRHNYDVIVIGAGHAGCEAALATARMGAKTLLTSINLLTIAQMSCNPAIGGLAKGHLVKEIDALGGQMGVIADDSGIQFRMLNTSKGPAVWSPRSQNDRMEYSLRMKGAIESQENLFLRQHDIKALLFKKNAIKGVITDVGTTLYARAVILTAGTFLNGLIHVGLTHFSGGRIGELASVGLSQQLREVGFEVGRLKTGTPPRIDGRTVDFSRMAIQRGDENPVPYSFRHDKIEAEQIPCFLTKTNRKTHDILKSGLDRSPLYTGIIQGIGPRYCPSIEDKIVRFADKPDHQIFLEPEGRRTNEYYINGFATSLPEDIQIDAVHSVPGLGKARLTRLGYAIEYDFFPPTQLKPTLETKLIDGLYFAGQVNGTSGYEEAAAQGLMAGINAVLKLRGESEFVLQRSEAYIGVLIDDLITKALSEPYRMFTSLAEYRLLLRQDNADLRLMHYGFQYGLIPRSAFAELNKRNQEIAKSLEILKGIRPSPDDLNPILQRAGSGLVTQRESLEKLLKRPEIELTDFTPLSDNPLFSQQVNRFWRKIQQQVQIEVKYEGFLARQKEQVMRMKQLEDHPIPDSLDYKALTSISAEGREKLQRIKPRTLGQASRILGVSPADITVLLVYLGKTKKRRNVSRETSVE